MAGDFRLNLDAAAIEDLGYDDDVEELLDDITEQVVSLAQEKAPKDTGDGADSIHGEAGTDADGAYVDISWDDEHFYMAFHELGTEHQPATPFLRPALDQTKV